MANLTRSLVPSRWMRDASDVKIVKALETHYQNPLIFILCQTLINVVTGQVASKEVEGSMGSVINLGTEEARGPTKKCLGEKGTFWALQQMVGIKTFSDMRRPPPGEKKKKLVASAEVLFRWLLAVSKLHAIDLKYVLKYEPTALPPALFNDNGTLRKTSKAELAKKVESVCNEVHILRAVHPTA